MVVLAPHKRFTVENYYCMAETGILTKDDRVELIEGDIIQMPPMGPRNGGCIARLNRMLITTLPSEPIVSVQTPIRLNNYSEPQPDFLILKPRFDFYATKHPKPTDVFALIEVSDSTIQADRTVKTPLYSREGIQELWILNLKNPSLEVYRSPASDGYQDITGIKQHSTGFISSFSRDLLCGRALVGSDAIADHIEITP